MANFSTAIPTTPLRWVAALFTVNSPRRPLQAAVFSPENSAILGGAAIDDSPSDQGSPAITMSSPASHPPQPSDATIKAFKEYSLRSADLINELTQTSASHVNPAGYSTRSRQLRLPAQQIGFKAAGNTHFGSDLQRPFPLLPLAVIDGDEELETRPAKRQRNTGVASRVTKVAPQVRKDRKRAGETATGPKLRQPSENKGELTLEPRKLRSLPKTPAQKDNLTVVVPQRRYPRRNTAKPTPIVEAPKASQRSQRTKPTNTANLPPVASEKSQGRRQPATTAVKTAQESLGKQPGTKAAPRQATKKNGTNSKKRQLGVRPLATKGEKGKSTPRVIPPPPPPVDEDGPESESEAED